MIEWTVSMSMAWQKYINRLMYWRDEHEYADDDGVTFERWSWRWQFGDDYGDYFWNVFIYFERENMMDINLWMVIKLSCLCPVTNRDKNI